MIAKFEGKYRFLSNFWEMPIVYRGLNFNSSEAAYQAAKCLVEEDRKRFQGLSASASRKLGKHIRIRSDWDRIRVDVMREILEIKFANPEMRKLLLETYEEELIEGNYWHDHFWGVCDGRGQNMLGQLLMRLREKLQNGVHQL